MLSRASADLVFLSGGVPNPEMFPFVSTAMTLKDGSVINIQGKSMIDALQYSPTPGYKNVAATTAAANSKFK